MAMDDAEWGRLLATVRELQELFPEGLVFIGGIAVYAHAMASPETAKLAAMSHDADLMILAADYADLRDLEVLTPNRRLSKQQFEKNGFEFDVYVERQHDLPVPVDEAVARSQMRSGLRVACPEHLIVLKLKAYADRKGSGKGEKDEDDVVRILLVADDFRQDGLTRLTDDMAALLRKIVDGDAPVRLAGGNLHEARIVRAKARAAAERILAAHHANYGG